MSWSDPSGRLRAGLLALGLGLGLAGCGLTPVYAPGQSGALLAGQVSLSAPESPEDYHFHRRLSDRLGPANAARYDLDTDIAIAVVGQAITPEEVTTRYTLNGSAAYTLRARDSGVVVTAGEVSSFTSYSATGTTVSTLAAERDARARLMVMLADQVMTRLLAADLTGTGTP